MFGRCQVPAAGMQACVPVNWRQDLLCMDQQASKKHEQDSCARRRGAARRGAARGPARALSVSELASWMTM